MNYCSPNNNINNIDINSHYTCFTLKELQEIAIAFNIYIYSNNICLNKNKCVPKKLINIKNKDKRELWYSIYNRLEPICKYEYCWIDLEFIKLIPNEELCKKIQYFTFKPKMTDTNYSWLSNSDINYVLQQYEKLDSDFYYLGALPSDFYKLTDFDYKKLKNYNLIGAVINLDKSTQNGSHWVALIIDNISNTIEYFDSLGNKPNKRIRDFIKILKKKYFIDFKSKVNKYIHQRKNTECGVYSIYFIIQRLLGKNFDQITSNIIKDHDMNKFRKYIFRPRTTIKYKNFTENNQDIDPDTDKNNTKVGGFDKNTTKYPRKWSKEYCMTTPCNKMGFSQKSSCRYYKNCYK